MKNRIVIFTIVALTLTLAWPAGAAEKGEWVRIPSKWLLHRFVRPSSAPPHTYRIALVVPPGAKQAKVAQSSGLSDVDELAGDFALGSIESNAALKALAKSKELYFQFVVTPPMLDIKMRSKEGQRPAPAGKELYTPTAQTFYTSANQNEATSRSGKLSVIFPPEGGYASEALVTLSTRESSRGPLLSAFRGAKLADDSQVLEGANSPNHLWCRGAATLAIDSRSVALSLRGRGRVREI
jgi:hypothetical protein